ncbi:MAG: RagB/SusD family nutrient uptake outer membrane protein [Paraprevotella sp.]|nr:RagB/SusD family nutrient uptake outer membrane protein [Paraprevotella sp.]
MKTKIKIFLLALLTGGLAGCIDEAVPADSFITSDQLDNSKEGLTRLTNAITGFPSTICGIYSTSNFDFGYPGLGVVRDVLCEDFSTSNNYYDYFSSWGFCTYLGNDYNTCYYPWSFYYKWNETVTELMKRVNPETQDAQELHAMGIAHFYRAWIYFDMARMFEFKKTGISRIDDRADPAIHGLTVPIVTEETTQEDAFNLPRAPYHTMYKFILDELDLAEQQLGDYKRTEKNEPNLAVVYGEKARVWLELASHFDKYPEDLADMSQYPELGITSATDCYAKAQSYAQQAIDQSGAIPMTESEWYSTDGFTKTSTSSWMLGMLINKEALNLSAWINFVGEVSAETSFGTGGYNYGTFRTIGKSLYDQISDDDWRKQSWVNPDDAYNEDAQSQYKTILTPEQFAYLDPYTNLKFQPADGNEDDYQVGALADYPMMRVEEMYFIVAEASAHTGGLSSGIHNLESFINSYRYNYGQQRYTCNASTMDDFIQALMVQKRIEFWGEGLVYWDYKRLELPITRGYEGTNIPVSYRFNSLKGYCAPWLDFYIPNYECGQDKAIVPNPTPSMLDSELWRE